MVLRLQFAGGQALYHCITLGSERQCQPDIINISNYVVGYNYVRQPNMTRGSTI